MPRKRLLIVDDDADIRLVIRLPVEFAPLDVDIIEAEDGVVALEMMTAEPVDVVMVDATMPHMDGFTLVRLMGEAGPPLSETAVLAFDGVVGEDRWRACNPPAVFRYLAKPCGPDEIVEALRGVGL